MDIESPGQTGHGHNKHDHSHSHDHNKHHHSHSHEHETVNSSSLEMNSESPSKEDPDVFRRKNVLRRLVTASLLCLSFLLVEVIGGLLAGSLAILSDAAHLFADLASFAVAIAAAYLASLPPSERHTYGLKRTEALAALFSMISLAIISAGLAIEAVRRLWPYIVSWLSSTSVTAEIDVVDGKLMSLIASIGVGVNICLALVLGEHHVHLPGGDHGHDHDHDHAHTHDHSHSHGHGHDNGHGCLANDTSNEEAKPLVSTTEQGSYGSEVIHTDEITPHEEKERNINLHAAYLHVLGDLAQSVAVLIAGLIIWANPNYSIADPICTIFFAIMVFYSTISVIRSSISILLEEVPPGLSWVKVHEAISSLEGVSNVHDLHIWSISHGEPALSVHVNASNPEQALKSIRKVCRNFKITHATIQVQPSSLPDCITCGDGMVACHN
eukprot:CAMPEP_0183291686 /NCGR_PEP_ID=MMETSP0160_2-20130417/1015_1 /TAXON_ID=2839 ORGANISM="Odontella Sinensis, Strain Grunow 1884" /NCGR_SAMPLE_ID=MMETSP0160_2 /ASSEMBLY_ACC=CAM_ASM_000250 /LENGTH=439 /DNA_ID=CAMNT_0025452521 /DNA_START=59 /DNA_END=1378 /DNA_ORIENTATION=-